MLQDYCVEFSIVMCMVASTGKVNCSFRLTLRPTFKTRPYQIIGLDTFRILQYGGCVEMTPVPSKSGCVEMTPVRSKSGGVEMTPVPSKM